MPHQPHHRAGQIQHEDRAAGGLAAWRSGAAPPLIGITTDVADPALPGMPPKPRSQVALGYSLAIAAAGGVPVLLPQTLESISEYVRRLDGFVFTGGDDPRTEAFGVPTHPKATPLHPLRQQFELALFDELAKHPEKPVLGVCLGMQLMALHAGGSLNQHMPDDVPTADGHYKDSLHRVTPAGEEPTAAARSGGCVIPSGEVTSHHRQAVRDAGRLRVLATADDGVIEAIGDPARKFYIGLQWHPERTASVELGSGIFRQFVGACRM